MFIRLLFSLRTAGGATGAVAEASGYNDAVSSYNSVKSGDYSGAAVSALGIVCKVCKGAKKLNGNSKASMKDQHLYMIEDVDGNIKKIGVSGQKLNKNGSSPRANSQLQSGDTATVLESGIPGRATVLQKEGQVVEGLRKAGERLPDNQRPKIH